MEKDRPRRVSESYSSEQAEIIWAAAARMQAEAEAKLQGASTILSPPSHDVEFDDSHSSFDFSELTEIADHAGISSDYVELAVLQSKLDDVSPRQDEDPLLSRIVGLRDNGNVNCEAILDYSIDEVNAAIQRVFPSNQYALQLIDALGDGEPGDTVLKFRAQPGNPTLGRIQQIFVTLHPIGKDKCQIKLRAEQYFLGTTGQFNLALLVGAGVCWWPIPPMLGDYSSLTIGLAAAGAFLIAFAGLLMLNRWDNGKGMRTGNASLEELLQAIRADVKTKGLFAGQSREVNQ